MRERKWLRCFKKTETTTTDQQFGGENSSFSLLKWVPRVSFIQRDVLLVQLVHRDVLMRSFRLVIMFILVSDEVASEDALYVTWTGGESRIGRD